MSEKNKGSLQDIDGLNDGSYFNVYPYREIKEDICEGVVLQCTPLKFYTKNDEDLLFKWIKKIKCINKCYGIGKILYLCIESKSISNKYFADLMALFTRYNFDKAQLKIFMNESNKNWF